MRYYILIFSVLLTTIVFGQGSSINKPVIDSMAIVNWPSVAWQAALISGDGRFISYELDNHSFQRTVIVQSVDKKWKKKYPDAGKYFFSGDSKNFIYSSKDTLNIVTPGSENVEQIKGVQNSQSPKEAEVHWLAYQLTLNPEDLILRDLYSKKEYHYQGVKHYWFSDKGNVLLLEQTDKESSDVKKLQWVNIGNLQILPIWKGVDNQTIGGINFDKENKQLVFTITDQNKSNTIWYYKSGAGKSIEKVNNQSSGISQGLTVGLGAHLNDNGKYILFNLMPPMDTRKPRPDAVQVDVYSYRDSIVQGQQLSRINDPLAGYLSAVSVGGSQITRLQKEGEVNSGGIHVYDYVIFSDKNTAGGAGGAGHWWPTYGRGSYWQVSLQDGRRKELPIKTEQLFLSPDDRYLLYADNENRGWFSYCFSTGESRSISSSIPVNWLQEESAIKYALPGAMIYLKRPIWSSDSKFALVYDNYDIWKLDPEGIRSPVNLTNGYGRTHHVKFALLDYNSTCTLGSEFMVTAFNPENKENGFFNIRLGKKEDPKLLTMGPYIYFISGLRAAAEFREGMAPVKAAHADIWLLRRQTASESPNYLVTKDFKKLEMVSDIHPEEKYNWLTSELIQYSQLDGSMSQGILYKPEDFNAAKKYPVIFLHYWEKSDCLHAFFEPDFSHGEMNIPWFVSRGYLVFLPDVHYTNASQSGSVVGDCGTNSLVGAAKYLSKLPYVDAKRLGIQGQSHGGGQTLGVIVRSNVFAAACASAPGISNEISFYLGSNESSKAVDGRNDMLYFTESASGQEHIGATLWERPDLYIKASAVFSADKVKTPLLIIQNHGDNNVDFSQGYQMYQAMRRLQKPCWMLQYDHGGHGVDGTDAIDYTIRMTQFFDHYLKGAPAPVWMTKGIPAHLKGIETGYELDPNGKP